MDAALENKKKGYKKSRSPRVDYGPKKVISYRKSLHFLEVFCR